MPQNLLINWFKSFDSALVAFSGGLDSSVVAKAAQLAFGPKTLAVTAWSPSGCANEKSDAETIANEIGIPHLLVESREFDDPQFLRNDKNRCYHCKRVRFAEMLQIAKERQFQVVLDGSNADDSSDYRPGKRAAEELGVRSPLAELGITKATVREIANQWKLSVWNKPAEPCLCTRVPYDQPLDISLLRRIEAAEAFLKHLGFSPVRVRVQGENAARIEVLPDQFERLMESDIRKSVVEHFRSLDFRTISVDLQGFRSGSMNN